MDSLRISHFLFPKSYHYNTQDFSPFNLTSYKAKGGDHTQHSTCIQPQGGSLATPSHHLGSLVYKGLQSSPRASLSGDVCD
jgi:hypothetical protein